MKRIPRAVLVVGLGLALSACANPPVVHGALAGLQPSLLPRRGELVWFLCRWRPGTVEVRVAGTRDAVDRRIVAAALAAWEREGLGIRFEVRDDTAPGGIRIRMHDVLPGGRGTARASADCAVPESAAEARLVRATIDVARETGPDWRRRSHPLDEAERLGTLIHEIGHALGFSGHARAARDPLAAAPEVSRRVGRRVLAGEAIEAHSVRALYADERRVLARVEAPGDRTSTIDDAAARAWAAGWEGPFVRTGQRSVRIEWREAGATREAYLVPRPRIVERRPETLLILDVSDDDD